VPIGSLTGGVTIATAMNASNQVVGYSSLSDEYRAFLWEAGTMRGLGSIGRASSFAADINKTGAVVGWISPWGAYSRAVKFEDGAVVDLGARFSAESYAYGINEAGVIVGAARRNSNEVSSPWILAPAATNLLGSDLVMGGGFTASCINNAGQIGINSSSWDLPYTTGSELLPAGSTFRSAQALWDGGEIVRLNDLGNAVGRGRLKYFVDRAVLWRDGALVQLAAPGKAVAVALNNMGLAAGHLYSEGVGVGQRSWRQAILWENEMGYSLFELISDSAKLDGAVLQVAGLNDSGAVLVNADWSLRTQVNPATGTTEFVDPFRPKEAFLLLPTTQIDLPRVTITAPLEEQTFAARQPFTVTWNSSAPLQSLQAVIFSVVRTSPYLELSVTMNPRGSYLFTNSLPAGATSLTLSNLPAGPLAIRLQGRDTYGVPFASLPRVVRLTGPPELYVIGPSVNDPSLFRVGIYGDPERYYGVEWTADFVQWHSAPAAFEGYVIPYSDNSSIFCRAVETTPSGN
jgi:probable HAF family extracellular repeat protein